MSLNATGYVKSTVYLRKFYGFIQYTFPIDKISRRVGKNLQEGKGMRERKTRTGKQKLKTEYDIYIVNTAVRQGIAVFFYWLALAIERKRVFQQENEQAKEKTTCYAGVSKSALALSKSLLCYN